MTLPTNPAALTALIQALATLLEQIRLLVPALRRQRSIHPAGAYETLSLELILELRDTQGEHAVLTRRQRVRFLGDTGLVRELVWGEGAQLRHYRIRGAERLALRAEGSRQAVLLSPQLHRGVSDRLTIESRRTIRGGFRRRREYCEVSLERPAGPIALTVLFPVSRPPRSAQLVQAATETPLRSISVRYHADGRPVLRCRLLSPDPAVIYSLRWVW